MPVATRRPLVLSPKWVSAALFSLLLFASAAALMVLGVLLLLAGGSPYYVAAALLLLAATPFVFLRDERGAWIFGVLLLLTIAWAIWEAGFDAWPLVARLVAPSALGLYFLLPFAAEKRRISNSALIAKAVGFCSLSVLVVLTLLLCRARPAQPAEVSQTIALRTSAAADAGDWRNYGRDPAGTRFSPLDQIDVHNVAHLARAWVYRTGHDYAGPTATFETTPLAIGGRLFLCTPSDEVIALDGDTGRPLWRFDPHASTSAPGMTICRGVSWYANPLATKGDVCSERVIVATIDGRLIALDAERGLACPEFGANGQVDLLEGLGPVERGYYQITSAPQVVRGNLVLGGSIADNMSVNEPSGVIRAYDAVTGRLAWAFDVARPETHDTPESGQQYTRGTPNSWGPISADEQLGLVYVPTGNATPDWYGGQRRDFDDRYSSSVLALDAQTGALRWSFQTTHHDLWDYDIGSQPALFDMELAGARVPALAQPTKRGEVFILDRRTGKPIWSVVERRVPASTVPGEHAAPTQPYSTGFPSFAGRRLTEAMMWGLTPIDQAWCRLHFLRSHYEGSLTPPRLDQWVIVDPGYMGGSDWGSGSIDLDRHILILNVTHLALQAMLLTRREADARGLKPLSSTNHGAMGGAAPMLGTPYAVDLKPFMSPLNVPCQQPPYGELAAVDLATRRILWRQPLGTARESGPLGVHSHLPFVMGVPNQGGAITTRGGLTFIAAAQDQYLRAFDSVTGIQLWRAELPAGGQATPMTYRSNKTGRQFVVIAAGGHVPLGTQRGDYVVAFALPN
jgi:quinoprotein glucose dehydrogenase